MATPQPLHHAPTRTLRLFASQLNVSSHSGSPYRKSGYLLSARAVSSFISDLKTVTAFNVRAAVDASVRCETLSICNFFRFPKVAASDYDYCTHLFSCIN